MDNESDIHNQFMRSAIELARQGEGHVEPNPMVGCVLVRNNEIVGQGFHESFGGPHAEINAIRSCQNSAGTTAYVTLEPCCHVGKTGPCTKALIDAGVEKVVVGVADPFPQVAGKGIAELRAAKIEVQTGICEREAKELIRPYTKRLNTGMPWVIAKWAMTLDGRIATATGSSQWISNEHSRQLVHQLRGRMDAIIVGVGTAIEDDPMLTARPSSVRVAKRVVLDSQARISLNSKLVRTATSVPVIVFTSRNATPEKVADLRNAGCEVLHCDGDTHQERIIQAMKALGAMNCTNVLVEGGNAVLGSLNDAGLIDEAHCFVAPKLIGGQSSLAAIGGDGIAAMSAAKMLDNLQIDILENDVYIRGRVREK